MTRSGPPRSAVACCGLRWILAICRLAGCAAAEPYGYDVDLARALAEQLGLRVEFVPSNLDSIYDDLQADRADLAVSALPYAPEQGWRARFSSFYLNAGQVLLVPVGSALTRDTLGGRRIGAALGSDAAAELRRMARADLTLRVQDSYDLPPDAVAALVRGELDAAVVDNVAALTAINGGAPVRIAAALTLEPYVVAMPVAGFALNERVNAALEDLRRAGRFEELGAKWFR